MGNSTGNTTNTPEFMSAVSSNYQLLASSPAIDAGIYPTVGGTTDLGGQARVVNHIIDRGAYEYQGIINADTDGDGIPNAYEAENGLDPTFEDEDEDGDDQLNGEEYIAGTRANDSNSFFAVDRITIMSPAHVRFDTVTGRAYSVHYSNELVADPPSWSLLSNSVVGTDAPVIVIDPDDSANRNYRVRVTMP